MAAERIAAALARLESVPRLRPTVSSALRQAVAVALRVELQD